MSRLKLMTQSKSERILDDIYKDVIRRISSAPSLLCPVEMVSAFLRLCHSQSCGKCVPCRVGVGNVVQMLERILDGEADMELLGKMEKTARVIRDSADCAIGFEAASMVLRGLEGFYDDFVWHVRNGRCSIDSQQYIPCISMCPAGVEIPDYIAAVGAGQYADAIRIIRKDNPFPGVCGYVCEHPCEERCRRRIVDDAVNIRGLKRVAADNAGSVPPPEPIYEPTGKRVAVIGGGPAGLTAAYYLRLMGHDTEVFEKNDKLGGMLRYGIPRYRLPGANLDMDIDCILKTGVAVHTGTEIGSGIMFEELREKFDAVFIAIGAHTDKKLDIPGVEGSGVIPAIEMLRQLGAGSIPDFSGKTVTVVGGGNVAMDAARSAVRSGAKRVNIAYRRRREDMTALPEEVDGAVAEGCELITLMAPHSIERDENGNITAYIAKPQYAGKLDSGGRPTPVDSGGAPVRYPCDLIIVAIGQAIESEHFGSSRIPLNRDAIRAGDDAVVDEHEGVFAGGDCVTGPATVISAIASGKVAAANIDVYLGFHHTIEPLVETLPHGIVDVTPWGRANMVDREASNRKDDFEAIECPLSCETATREAARCLRCDHYGHGPYYENRRKKW